eukprot:UN3699
MTYRHFAASRIQHFIRSQNRRALRPEKRVSVAASLAKSATMVTNATFHEGGAKRPSSGQVLASNELKELKASLDALHLKLDALQAQDPALAMQGSSANMDRGARMPAHSKSTTSAAVQDSAYGRNQHALI